MIHFVGAGSGAVDLITVRGAQILKNTDVVIYAGSLVNPELISTYCRSDVEIYNSAKMTLEEVTDVEIEADHAGKDVVRLHTGDPSLYSAIHEQIEILIKHDVAFDVTPGVSAFSAAAAAVGAELTIPNVSQSLTITRVDGRTRVPEKESLASYAKHHATLALYLSAGQAERVRDELVSGYSIDTPVVVVYKASWPDQKILRTTLGELPERMEEAGIHNFGVILVGDTLAEGEIPGEENSKLYDNNFETGFRKTNKSGQNNDNPADIHASLKPNIVVENHEIDEVVRLRPPKKNIAQMIMLSFTTHGDLIMQEVRDKYLSRHPEIENICAIKHGVLEGDSIPCLISDNFDKVKAFIFVSAIGIAVRYIAPYIKSKTTDPAVVVVDEMGENVIPILSGHIGGANDLAREVSEILTANCIITTATDLEHKFAVDEFAKSHGFYITDFKKAKEISAKALRGEEILINKGKRSDVLISPYRSDDKYFEASSADSDADHDLENNVISPLILVPKCIAVGIGCRRGVRAEEIGAAIEEALSDNDLYFESISGIASIDIKFHEFGIVQYIRNTGINFDCYTADQLKEVPGEFIKSDFVEKTVGVDNVSGRAAMLLAKNTYKSLPDSERQYYGWPKILMDKKAYGNVTVAIAIV